MRTIDDYCDAAKRRNCLQSDRELGRRLGRAAITVSQWRTKRTWPSDATMVTLAEMAGVPVEEALLELNIWRSADGPAASAYKAIIAALHKAAAITVLVSGSFLVRNDLAAGTTGQHLSVDAAPVYIMENTR